MNRRTLTTVLHLDGAGNVAAGIVLVATGGWLAAPAGLTVGWPLHLAGVLLAGYGIENHFVARRPSRAKLTGLAAVDIGFATAALGLAITDPTAAAAWVRWVLVATAVASLTFGLSKLVGRTGVHDERRATAT